MEQTYPLARSRPSGQRSITLVINTLYYVVCIVLALLFLAPLLWSTVTAFKPLPDALANPLNLLPTHITWSNFQALENSGNGLTTYITNSAVVALGTVAGTILLSTLGGYGFARFQFPGKNILFVLILITLMIPFQSILTPLYLVLRVFHLQNTLLGLTLVYITFQIPFGIFVMRNVFEGVPREIEEAALIDGCSEWSVLYRVMLTIVLPGIITVGLFAFLNSWNEFLAALIFMTDSSKFTLPILLLNATSGQFGSVNLGAVQAGVVVTMFPCLILFLLLQRYYVNGLAAGAVKA
jgi:multiple sugar transport system permease protein